MSALVLLASQLRICRISPYEVNLAPLNREATREGFRFLDRLLDDWTSGQNRFEKSGEELLGVYATEQLIAVGGLNHEPYEPAPRTARLRHLYVHPAYRRTGVGKTVVRHLLNRAGGAFDEVRLRTDNPAAAAFYEALGFKRVSLSTATHLLKLGD